MSIERFGGIDKYETNVLEDEDGFLCIYINYQALQAKIDALMMEYCPEEMTEKQLEEWAANQIPVDINEP